jgi:hypothetical protein
MNINVLGRDGERAAERAELGQRGTEVLARHLERDLRTPREWRVPRPQLDQRQLGDLPGRERGQHPLDALGLRRLDDVGEAHRLPEPARRHRLGDLPRKLDRGARHADAAPILGDVQHNQLLVVAVVDADATVVPVVVRSVVAAQHEQVRTVGHRDDHLELRPRTGPALDLGDRVLDARG